MAAVTFDGPGGEGEGGVNAARAARWLGVSESTFLRMIGRKKGGPVIAEADTWFRCYRNGKETMYPVEDLVLLRHALLNRRGAPPEDEEEEKT